MKFIDSAEISVSSGHGGRGHVSFRREKFVAKGGPDGGNGGRGGDVVFEANPNMNTLLDFRYQRNYQAEDGKPGAKSRKTGKDGKDVVIKVPVGTEIINIENNELIADITESNSKIVIAKGGIGGKGNSEFATATRQAPRFAQDGLPGEEFQVRLELKLLANVGIVGFPNVGKSTLISVISAAKPKIADYPFTTLIPNIGIVKVGDYDTFAVADIPGLIEGASEGKGLGHEFLKHVERTQVLLYLIDAYSEDPVSDYETLKNELSTYNPEMLEKSEIIALSRVDGLIEEQREEINNLEINGNKPLLISSISGENIDQLVNQMWNAVQANI